MTAAILRRRSVREGLIRKLVPPNVIEEILLCGLSAPASKSAAPCRFHVVTDPQVLDRIADMAAVDPDAEAWVPSNPAEAPGTSRWSSTVVESAQVLRQASVGIVVEDRAPFTGGTQVLIDASRASLAGALFARALEMVGVGAAVENMFLAADAMGLAGAFMGDPIVAEDGIRSLLGASGDLVGILALGYTDDRPEPSDRGNRLDDKEFVVWHGTSRS